MKVRKKDNQKNGWREGKGKGKERKIKSQEERMERGRGKRYNDKKGRKIDGKR